MGSNPRNSVAPSRTPSMVPSTGSAGRCDFKQARKQHQCRWGGRGHVLRPLGLPQSASAEACVTSPWPRSSGPPWRSSARLAASRSASATTRAASAVTVCATTRVQVCAASHWLQLEGKPRSCAHDVSRTAPLHADSDSGRCMLGTDCADCDPRRTEEVGAFLCGSSCTAGRKGQCDDGGPGAHTGRGARQGGQCGREFSVQLDGVRRGCAGTWLTDRT